MVAKINEECRLRDVKRHRNDSSRIVLLAGVVRQIREIKLFGEDLGRNANERNGSAAAARRVTIMRRWALCERPLKLVDAPSVGGRGGLRAIRPRVSWQTPWLTDVPLRGRIPRSHACATRHIPLSFTFFPAVSLLVGILSTLAAAVSRP
ncbi:hypothetical protein DBV15_00913 [Temnothorax longispinosus]|uniref:Uncharacterized protein n=1 Tax=Temnothorax longispinosus TaxID=300112 RepID=A0A4S2JGC9_9HYME|nr:hypothetical protein DBV15_00913 [Temnothorax longispinosus]